MSPAHPAQSGGERPPQGMDAAAQPSIYAGRRGGPPGVQKVS